MKKVTVFFFFSLFLFSLRGQHANFNSQRNWSLHKKELQIGVGATQFNGDLGGAEGIGRDYSLKDINWPSTGIAFWLGYRQRFHPYFATTSSLCVFNLKGADSLSANANRNSRNLHFRSFGIEIQQRLEWIFAANEKFGSTYNLPGNYSKKNRSQQYYLFGGIGLCYFNPRAMDPNTGEWTSLRKLRTEGQDKAYSPLTFTLPMGIGFRMVFLRCGVWVLSWLMLKHLLTIWMMLAQYMPIHRYYNKLVLKNLEIWLIQQKQLSHLVSSVAIQIKKMHIII
jgi:hypothetical protein